MADGHEGGRSDGEWWRVDRPQRVLGQPGGAAPEESVYTPEGPADPPPAAAQAGPAPAVGAPAAGAPRPRRVVPGPGPSAADFPGWDSVTFDFGSAEPAAAPVVPDPRKDPAEAAVPATGDTPAAPTGKPPRAAGLLAGRRPSPLLLIAAVVLLAGALTGQILIMLVGWAAAYLSARLGDLTKKFAVFGIPMATMTASTVWYWGRAKGRWGSPVAPDQFNHAALTAAPTVLRLAAVLSALFLLVVNLRRSPKG
ncbi:hypothetical protein GCM10010430_40090 [Kitasatospora cystarginea]|uniref:Integral membrane protein n=2 Tax=Streptomycetaceae TaxID=2062 RepID=A0ABN3EA81_9ACTN